MSTKKHEKDFCRRDAEMGRDAENFKPRIKKGYIPKYGMENLFPAECFVPIRLTESIKNALSIAA